MTTLILQHKQSGLSLTQSLGLVFSTLQLWLDKSRQRQQLAQLDARQLSDLGLDRDRVKMEVAKPFWQ